MSTSAFTSLSEEEQALVRNAQLRRKEAKQKRKKMTSCPTADGAADGAAAEDGAPTRCVITMEEYFQACPAGCFRDPNLPPTADSLELLLRVLEGNNEKARWLNTFNYFQFGGPDRALWDAEFNARLAWEGFFTITAPTGRWRRIQPLPELQPFYGVLTWPNFEASKQVRSGLGRLAKERRGYCLSNCVDPERTWRHIDSYHARRHGSNWLTREYFDMILRAHRDPSINFALHCIELSAPAPPPAVSAGSRVRLVRFPSREELNGAEGVALHFDEDKEQWLVQCDGGGERLHVQAAGLVPLPPSLSPSDCAALPPIAGEIGFSIGSVYTSLSGWSGERTSSAVGTAQLLLLGRWLQSRGYSFWSLGHCYSPQMDYKRQLGHRIYTRAEFRALLQRHRGPFKLGERAESPEGSLARLSPLRDGEVCEEAELLRAERGRAA